jgi:hypothetical protein
MLEKQILKIDETLNIPGKTITGTLREINDPIFIVFANNLTYLVGNVTFDYSHYKFI